MTSKSSASRSFSPLARSLVGLLLTGAGALAGGTAAHAQSVALAGLLGSKALLVIDAHPPRAMAVGDEFQDVKVLAVTPDGATVEIKGVRRSMRMGEAPVSVGGRGGNSTAGGRGGNSTAGGRQVVLVSDSRGHFIQSGSINGKTIQYMVDTGASTVAIGRSDADRIGLDYKNAQRVQMGTANGVALGWRLKLDSVRIGDVEVNNLDATITPQAMPYVLLGNNFLSEFKMTRTRDQMVLEKRN